VRAAFLRHQQEGDAPLVQHAIVRQPGEGGGVCGPPAISGIG